MHVISPSFHVFLSTCVCVYVLVMMVISDEVFMFLTGVEAWCRGKSMMMMMMMMMTTTKQQENLLRSVFHSYLTWSFHIYSNETWLHGQARDRREECGKNNYL